MSDILSADLPVAVLSNLNSTTGEYKVVATLASTPGLPSVEDTDGQPILSNGCTVTDPFNNAGRHPISATLYEQLLQRNFQVGDAVVQGSVIANPNFPGSTVASDLRFEYVPNGSNSIGMVWHA